MSGGGFLGADAMVIDAYGVETLVDLVARVRDGRSPAGVPNTVVFEEGRAVGPLVREGETFDHVKMRMNWDLVEDEHLGNIVNVRTQISCPFRCSFCSYPTTQGPVIKAEVEMFERELQALSRRGVRRLMIVDDTFNVPPKRFVEILQVLRRYDFEWFSFIRCQFLKPEIVELMKESGCRGVYLGLESVDDETLKRMNKMATRDHFYCGVEMLAEHDILTQASFIVGFPGDTAETVLQVGDFIERSALDYYNLKLFWYDAATPIGQRAREFDLTGQGYNWKHSTMDSGEAHRLISHLIRETKGRYVGLHSGELWEIAHYGALGLERRHIDAIYDAHNSMLCHDLAGDREPGSKQQIFAELTAKLSDVTLTRSAP
jgi:p-methyltransferase